MENRKLILSSIWKVEKDAAGERLVTEAPLGTWVKRCSGNLVSSRTFSGDLSLEKITRKVVITS